MTQNPEPVLLPSWKETFKPFERLEIINISEDKKGLIISWWKNNSDIYKEIKELEELSVSPSLPKNEATSMQSIYSEAFKLFTNANASLLVYIKSTRIERSGDWLRRMAQSYINIFGFSQTPKQAEAAAEEIEKYVKNQKIFKLAASIASSIIKTRNRNTEDSMYCQKTAQLAMSLIFEKIEARKTVDADDAGYDSNPVIDKRIEEMVNLTDVFSKNLWSSEQRKQMLLNYNKLRRIFEKQEIGSAEKIGLVALWNWSNGKISNELNVFKILRFVKELNTNVTNSVADAWLAEETRVEDGQEK